MERSRIPKFYELSIQKRLEVLRDRDFISPDQFNSLCKEESSLRPEDADRMIENVIGVFSLPIGIGLNFLINGKDYAVPMAVEEPSIIAAVSNAAKTARPGGGFQSTLKHSLLIGQVQVVDIKNPTRAKQALLQNKEEILNLANSLHPRMAARGGGAKDVEVLIHPSSTHRGDMLVVHLLVDTKDAMGANLVNSMCEGTASLVEKISGGTVFLRILSNLSDRSLVKSKVRIPLENLATDIESAKEVRDGIILANDFAIIDPYRAATHNKGIMNGIDSVAIATGNDWRAIEAACHAYAARGNHYQSLTKWYKDDEGALCGFLEIPLKIGTVGGPLQSNPTVKIVHSIMGIKSAKELSEVMGAVGLAQNFSALRALCTEGIQRGHMSLHARTVASAAGAERDIFDQVVEMLIEEGEIKVWKAKEIIARLRNQKQNTVYFTRRGGSVDTRTGVGGGKVILFGEHAVVYGSHAVAASVPLAIEARAEKTKEGVHVLIPKWGVEKTLLKGEKFKYSIYESLVLILDELGLENQGVRIEIFPHVPRAMGLGGSAALAVAVIQALNNTFNLNLSLEEVNALAYKSEQIVHGTPSGIDNTLATYGEFILFKKGTPPFMQTLKPAKPLNLVVGITGIESLTAKMVADVREAREKNPAEYDAIFEEINKIALESVQVIETGDIKRIAELMNLNQALLQKIKVSGPEIDELISVARKNGALGAKLSGAGGGGVMFALCENSEIAEQVAKAITKTGYDSFTTIIGEHNDPSKRVANI
ncbi:MAG: hydroxymethylglutaryl-CoA reductase, degradative [Bdellovibrionota bacterium]